MKKRDTNNPLLEEIHIMSLIIQNHQEQIIELGKKRRRLVMQCRNEKVTYREIAENMGATEQNVYKIIRTENRHTQETTPHDE